MATPNYLVRPQAELTDTPGAIALPYGLTTAHVVTAINDIYAYLHATNSAAVMHGYPRLEDIIQPAAFSGLLSELVCRAFVHATAGATPGLVRNLYPNGRPDLVPRGSYAGDAVLHGPDGIEVKVSRFETSIQGHNPEAGWIMVVWISADLVAMPVYDRAPTYIDRIAVAELEEIDWTYAGRSETSRRTPTASINPTGRQKLAAGVVYRRAGAPPDRARRPVVTAQLPLPAEEPPPPRA